MEFSIFFYLCFASLRVFPIHKLKLQCKNGRKFIQLKMPLFQTSLNWFSWMYNVMPGKCIQLNDCVPMLLYLLLDGKIGAPLHSFSLSLCVASKYHQQNVETSTAMPDYVLCICTSQYMSENTPAKHKPTSTIAFFTMAFSVVSTTTNNQIMTNSVQHDILCTDGKQLRTMKCCSRYSKISFLPFSIFFSPREASNLATENRCVILCWLSGWLLTIQLGK